MINMVFLSSLLATAYSLLLAGVGLLYILKKRRVYVHQRLLARSDVHDDTVTTIGVFHPYANGGGGGERVLYCALAALVKHFKRQSLLDNKKRALRVLLYAGDDGLNAAQLIATAAARFHLPDLLTHQVETVVKLVPLTKRRVLEPAQYPRFTLFWQSVAHIRLALAAFAASEKMGFYPDVWLDTTGCPFSYVVAKGLYACTVAAYVHYPMISTDMITTVQQRSAAFNNNAAVARSAARSAAKYYYYRLFAMAYSVLGKTCTDVVMVNSTWTFHHIQALWGGRPSIVYPPCGAMDDVQAFDLTQRTPVALSIAQFRPEKHQLLQLQAMHVLLTTHKEEVARLAPSFKLVLLGSCRNADDEKRVALLKEQSADLGVSASVEFVVNASFDELKARLATSAMGLHTMFNEHFGISVVEMMAAGVAVVANNSGGPAADIVQPGTGFLALTADEYAACMLTILRASATELTELRTNARLASQRFSDDEFEKQFIDAMRAALRW